MTFGDGFSRGEKRKRNEKEGGEMLGVAGALRRMSADSNNSPLSDAQRQQQPSATMPQDKETDNDGWTTVGPKSKRQKKQQHPQQDKTKQDNKSSAGDSNRNNKNNYPAITHSNSARLQGHVKISDLQNLVLYLLADGNGPQWISVRHKKDIERVVCLLVPGLELDMFDGRIPLDPEKTKDEEMAIDAAGDIVGTDATKAPPPTVRKLKPINPDEYYPTKLLPEKLPTPLAPLADMFQHVWPIKTPGEYNRMHSPLYAMLNAPIPKRKEDKNIKGPKPPNVGRDFQSKRTPITEFIATRDELTDNGFAVHPIHLRNQEEKDFEAARRYKACRAPEDGWIDLPEDLTDIDAATVPFSSIEAGSVTAGRNVLFIDCEMVTTTVDKFALARVSLLSWDGTTIMDELVQPPDPVTDYLTMYSGISKAMLDPVTTTLGDIQQKLKILLTPQTILAGHSLDSDLKALKISFPFIVDTSLLYPHPKGPPQKSSLKWLCQKYLSREIQNRGPNGHDSVEDARACLDLVKQKCEKGKTWGTSEATGESIFKRLLRVSESDDGDGDAHACTGAVVDWGDPRRGYGSSATTAIPCENDADVVAGIKRVVSGAADPSLSDQEIARAILEEIPRAGASFTWARLRELEALRGWWNTSKSLDQAERLAKTLEAKDEGVTELSTEKLAEATAATVGKIRDIWESLPPRTAFIVYTGSGDPRDLRRLSDMQSQFKKAYQTLKWDELPVQWTDVEEQALKDAAVKARSGAGFVAVK